MHTSLTRCVALGATLALASALPAGAKQPSCYTPSTAQTTALVELYTSEGCDSCPPADQWLATLKPGTRIVPIAWHVGYWDSLGWKDRFALPDAAPRQRLQTQRDGGHTVYTPQVMVQGHRVDWRDAAQFERAVDAVQAKAAPVRIAVAQGLPYNGYIGVELDGGTQQAGVVGYIALLEDQIVSQVSAGENRGATLHHTRVVRQLVGPLPLSSADGTALKHVHAMSLPPGANPEHLHVVGWAEDAEGHVLQAAEAKCP